MVMHKERHHGWINQCRYDRANVHAFHPLDSQPSIFIDTMTPNHINCIE